MTGKFLGKITKAEYGEYPGYEYQMGLELQFHFDNSTVGCGGKYMVNMSSECQWSKEERADAIVKSVEHIKQILDDAKVHYVSQLVGKPVEITVDGSLFKGFRILTEVL
jgi:hypothetical protein